MADDFESDFMVGDASVRHADKRVSRAMAAIVGVWAPFCWALAIIIGFANASSDNPVPASALPLVLGAIAALGLMFAALAVTFAVLRTVVTSTEVNVKYGLWGPTIPLEQIRSCKVVDYEWTKFGGWGIRRGVGGKWAYVPGPGEVVEIEYGDGDIVQIGAKDPRKLALEIDRARQALARARIDVADSDVAAEERAAAKLETFEADSEERREDERRTR
jgi:hypothetical protein